MDAKPKAPTVEEKYAVRVHQDLPEDPPPAEPVEEEEEIAEPPPPPKKVRIRQQPKPEPIEEEDEWEEPSYRDREYFGLEPAYVPRHGGGEAATALRAPTYYEILVARQREQAKQRALTQVNPIRSHFRAR